MSHTLEERSRQLMIQRKFEQCQKEIETAMAENPHCAIPHKLMWILLEKESNHVLAMKHFRAAYALDPTYVPARYNMEQYAQMYVSDRKMLSQYGLADAIGISRESIARYETGKRGVTVGVLDIYSDYFNVSVEYIMYGTDEKRTINRELQQLMIMLGNVPEGQQELVYVMMKGMLEKIV